MIDSNVHTVSVYYKTVSIQQKYNWNPFKGLSYCYSPYLIGTKSQKFLLLLTQIFPVYFTEKHSQAMNIYTFLFLSDLNSQILWLLQILKFWQNELKILKPLFAATTFTLLVYILKSNASHLNVNLWITSESSGLVYRYYPLQ